MSRFGFGRSIITVDAPTNVGLSAAASAKRNMSPIAAR